MPDKRLRKLPWEGVQMEAEREAVQKPEDSDKEAGRDWSLMG